MFDWVPFFFCVYLQYHCQVDLPWWVWLVAVLVGCFNVQKITWRKR